MLAHFESQITHLVV